MSGEKTLMMAIRNDELEIGIARQTGYDAFAYSWFLILNS